jgi:hypothetical protein
MTIYKDLRLKRERLPGGYHIGIYRGFLIPMKLLGNTEIMKKKKVGQKCANTN